MDDSTRRIQEYADSLLAAMVGGFLIGYGIWTAWNRTLAVLTLRDLLARHPRLSRALLVGRIANDDRAARVLVWTIAGASLFLGVVALIVALKELSFASSGP